MSKADTFWFGRQVLHRMIPVALALPAMGQESNAAGRVDTLTATMAASRAVLRWHESIETRVTSLKGEAEMANELEQVSAFHGAVPCRSQREEARLTPMARLRRMQAALPSATSGGNRNPND